jgi:hypothetical protein
MSAASKLPQYQTPYWQKTLNQPDFIALELGIAEWGDYTSDDDRSPSSTEPKREKEMNKIIAKQIAETEKMKQIMQGVGVLFQMLTQYPDDIRTDMYEHITGMILEFPIKCRKHIIKLTKLKQLKKACYDTFSPAAFERLKPHIKNALKTESELGGYYKIKKRLRELEKFFVTQESID